MTRLIYHPVKESATDVSPFDATIIDIVSSKSIKLAFPYLSSKPFERVRRKCTDWKLLTDVEELLRNLERAERQWFIDLLIGNPRRVRHNKNLHAKVVLAGQKAIVGSANLTNRGLTKRVEMSVLISDRETVAELDAWFDELWKRCDEIKPSAIKAIVDFSSKLPNRSSSEGTSAALSLPRGPQIKARLKPVTETQHGRGSQSRTSADDRDKPTLSSGKVMVTIDNESVEWDRKKACVLYALQTVGPNHKGLKRQEIYEIIHPSLHIDSVHINKHCRELRDEGFAVLEKREGRGNFHFRRPTAEGMNVKLPPAKHLLTL